MRPYTPNTRRGELRNENLRSFRLVAKPFISIDVAYNVALGLSGYPRMNNFLAAAAIVGAGVVAWHGTDYAINHIIERSDNSPDQQTGQQG